MIYTSYFAKIKELEANNIIPIAICLWPPNWYKGLSYKKLAPTPDMLMQYRRDQNQENYLKKYKKFILNELDPYDVYKELLNMSNGNDIALLCYERPKDFCHRHIVAEWLKYCLPIAIAVKEWGLII